MKSIERRFKFFVEDGWGYYTNYHNKTIQIHSLSGTGIFTRLIRKDYI